MYSRRAEDLHLVFEALLKARLYRTVRSLALLDEVCVLLLQVKTVVQTMTDVTRGGIRRAADL